MPDDNRVHCRFCDWSTPKKFQTKGGQFRGPDKAQDRLRDHVASVHQQEYLKILDQLGDGGGAE